MSEQPDLILKNLKKKKLFLWLQVSVLFSMEVNASHYFRSVVLISYRCLRSRLSFPMFWIMPITKMIQIVNNSCMRYSNYPYENLVYIRHIKKSQTHWFVTFIVLIIFKGAKLTTCNPLAAFVPRWVIYKNSIVPETSTI